MASRRISASSVRPMDPILAIIPLPLRSISDVADPDSPLDASHLPVMALQNKVTYEIKVTTDPGRALITGLWKDIRKVKGPVLRGLAARPTYFHNGSAATLGEV